AQIATAALAVGVTPVVRVAGMEHWHASRMLDNGAQGIVFPHVDDAAQARRCADACRYPPVGKRSMGGALAQLGFAPVPVGEAARTINEETLVVVMIESPQGVAQADEIAAVKGVDALLIGTNDLCFEMGIPGQFNEPRVAEAYRKVIAACRKHGKFPGMGGMYTPELLERLIDRLHRLAVDRGDQVAAPDAGLRRRAARAFHHQALHAAAELLLLLGGERPHREAELAALLRAGLVAGARGLLALHLADRDAEGLLLAAAPHLELGLGAGLGL